MYQCTPQPALAGMRLQHYYSQGSPSTYKDLMGSQITCKGDRMKVQNLDIVETVVYVTEKKMYHPEKILQCKG